jgi:hypothetical protein
MSSAHCRRTSSAHAAHKWTEVFQTVRFYCDAEDKRNLSPLDCLRFRCADVKSPGHTPHVHMHTPETTRRCNGDSKGAAEEDDA